jgi:very-short-patch-repair endonuclease
MRPLGPPVAIHHARGYFVLRFLAEDICKELDTVLDSILKALSRRSSVAPLRLAPRGRN